MKKIRLLFDSLEKEIDKEVGRRLDEIIKEKENADNTIRKHDTGYNK